MKAIKTKSLMSLIYVALLSIPLVSIISRVIYVQANKNAYQSYSSEYVESAVNLDSSNVASLYNDGQSISFTFAEHNVQWNASFGFSDISIDLNDIFNVQTTWNKFYMYKDNQDIRFYTTANQSYLLSASDRTFNTFTYVVDLSVSSDTSIYDYGIANIFTFKKDKLDNVFEYSVSRLVSENNFGQLNFFEWFSGFLLNDQQQNLLYVRFANWYLCYAMLISLMQILFLCLMWFVNFSRKLLDRGMNYDW